MERPVSLAAFALFAKNTDLEKQRVKIVKENIRRTPACLQGVGQRKTEYSEASISFQR